MPLTLADIARVTGGSLDGDPLLVIERVRALELASAGELAIVIDGRLNGAVAKSAAAALVIPQDLALERTNVVRVADPKRALVRVLQLFQRGEGTPGIDHDAWVSPTAIIGERVSIAPFAYIGENVVIGDDSVIHPHVTIYPGTKIGRRVIIHAGSVIGSDGFGYAQTEQGHEKVPQLGIVEIEDDVEIGANCAIDRAPLEVTRVCAGTKIDNLVQIGHNTTIGRNCILVAQAGVAGSVVIGDRTMLGGQAGISDHVRIGPDVLVGAQAGVHSDIASGAWISTPAFPRERAGRAWAMFPHLPEYRDRVRKLEAKVEELEARLAQLLAEKP